MRSLAAAMQATLTNTTVAIGHRRDADYCVRYDWSTISIDVPGLHLTCVIGGDTH